MRAMRGGKEGEGAKRGRLHLHPFEELVDVGTLTHHPATVPRPHTVHEGPVELKHERADAAPERVYFGGKRMQ